MNDYSEPDAYGRTGEWESCWACCGSGIDYGETCLSCGGFGWVRADAGGVEKDGNE